MPRPDEGLIHAWLDGQLPPDEAARIEKLAATDPEWAAAVAEARGFVAASSRILSALDRVPADVVPKGTASRTTRLPWWTKIAAAVVVVVGGSVVVLQRAPEGRLSAPSIEQDAAQPTPDTSKGVVQSPVISPPVPVTATPSARARVSDAVPAAGVPADAVIGREDAPALRRKALAASPVTPPSAPAPSVSAIVAEERKAVQDSERVVVEVSAAKSLVAKAAPSTAPTALQSAVPSAVPSVARSVAPQAQQSTAQDLAQAQNALRAQRVMGGVVASRSAQGQQRQQATMCYRLVPDNLRGGTAIIMRAVRAAGDTLFLAPVEPNAPQRAWLVLRDGMRGVMTTSGDLRSATPITGTPAICPAP